MLRHGDDRLAVRLSQTPRLRYGIGSGTGQAMIECKELAGKTIRLCTLYEDDSYGPEIQMEFTDGTSFCVSLKTNIALEAKCFRDEGGQPQVLRDYTTPAIPR